MDWYLLAPFVIFRKLFVTLSSERSIPFKGVRLRVSSANRKL